MQDLGVVGIVVENRADNADDVQNIITRYGDSIISRMGVPSHDRYQGIITIAMEADRARVSQFVNDLESIEGVNASYCMLS